MNPPPSAVPPPSVISDGFKRPDRRSRCAIRLTALAASLFAIGCAATPAAAEVSPALDRVSVSVGGFHAEPTFGARVDTPYGTLDSGNVKRDAVTMPRLTVDVLLFDSQGFSFDYYRYDRTYSDSVNGSFALGQNQFAGSADASLRTQLEFGKLAYKWWLGSGDTVVGLGAGAAYYRIDLDARATATVNGASASYAASASEDAIAPLLEVGVRHAITPDLRLFADASGVWKNGGKLHGSIYNAALGVEWFPIRNVGLVLSYGVSDIDLKRDDDIDTRLRVKLKGPSAFVKARF